MGNFLAELKARGVLKVTTAYLVVCWLILEIGNTLFEIFELPRAGLQAIFVLLALGFPALLASAWYWRFAATETGPAERSGREGSQIAIVFGAVALFAVAVAIGVRFFGFGQQAEPAKGHAANAVTASPAQPDQAPAFSPPPRSVAVLSFVNMSGDAKDEYFSDGLSEELLNTLVRVQELKVAARTSSFSFKGTATDIPTIGRKLNVVAVLEGSVRKAGERVRITAQLINAASGYHLWSQTYDRDMKDIFALQTEIATSVASALKVALVGDDARKLVAGGTTNAQAFDAYLRGRKAGLPGDEPAMRAELAAYDQALALDPGYALAYSGRAEALAILAGDWIGDPAEKRRMNAEARAMAEKAVAMAPNSGQAHASLAFILSGTSADYAAIDAALQRGLALEPGNARLQSEYARFASSLGRPDALVAANRAVELDPLSASAQQGRGIVLFALRRYDEARAAYRESMRPDKKLGGTWAGLNEIAAGQPAAALPLCEPAREAWAAQACLAMAYHRLGRRKDAQAMLDRMRQEQGDSLAYQYAEIHAHWGEPARALEWLQTALRLHDPGLLDIKVDPFLDPLREKAEFQDIVKRLNLPS
jgi:serine/threonine-protein kinase